jgi:hypothetical protein
VWNVLTTSKRLREEKAYERQIQGFSDVGSWHRVVFGPA